MLCYTIIVLSVVMSDPRHTTICTLSLHDALPICRLAVERALQSGHCRNRLSAGVIGTRKSIRADPGRIVDRGVHIPATTTTAAGCGNPDRLAVRGQSDVRAGGQRIADDEIGRAHV